MPKRATYEVTINVTLSDEEAWACAQFLKRVCFNDYERRAVNEEEAYSMRDAGDKIREALREQGYAPR